MGKPLFFRVSANEYGENDIILPSDSSFSAGEDASKKIVADALDETFAEGKRSDYLFLFDSLENALLYLIKHKAYSHIYLVDVEDEDKVTKCDMNFIDGMMYLVRHYNGICDCAKKELLNAFAKGYWESSATESPCSEYLSRKATVRQHIFSIDEDGHQKLYREYNANGRRILELGEFKELYKKVYL